MLAEIFMLRVETATREAGEGRGAVRADHLANGADAADVRSKYSRGLNRERDGRKKPADWTAGGGDVRHLRRLGDIYFSHSIIVNYASQGIRVPRRFFRRRDGPQTILTS